MEILNTTDGWSPAIESRGGIRDGAGVAEATGLVHPVTGSTRTPHGWKLSWRQQIWSPGPN